VVVLAAGKGSRLTERGGGGPKWLTTVGGGSTIADRQLGAVASAYGPGADVLVVVGHRAEAVEGFLAARGGGPAPALVPNPRYDELNNWYSLLLALDAAPEGRDVVVLNSDLVADEGWFAEFLRFAAAPGRWGAALAVDDRRPLTDEAMKVAAEAGPAGARLCTAIGKVGVDEPIGEYVGMTAIRADHVPTVAEVLRTFVGDPARADAWYEGGFRVLMERERLFEVWPVPTTSWVEVDDGRDLDAAEALFG
jgi:choline kinase